MSHHLPLADQETLTLSRDVMRRTTPRHQLVIAPEHLARCGGDLWQARALTLAERAHLTHTVGEREWVNRHALPIEGEPFGPALELFRVPSVSEPWRSYTVAYDATTDRYHCDCPASELGGGKPCKHAGAVCGFILTVREARTPAARAAQLSYERMCEDQDARWGVLPKSGWEGVGEE